MNRETIQTLIELHTADKIPNYRMVENAVNPLALKVKSKAIQAKALKDHESMVNEYKDACRPQAALRGSLRRKDSGPEARS